MFGNIARARDAIQLTAANEALQRQLATAQTAEAAAKQQAADAHTRLESAAAAAAALEHMVAGSSKALEDAVSKVRTLADTQSLLYLFVYDGL